MTLSIIGGRGSCLVFVVGCLGGVVLLLVFHCCFPLSSRSSTLAEVPPPTRVERPGYVACGYWPGRKESREVRHPEHLPNDPYAEEFVKYVHFNGLLEEREPPRPRGGDELVWYSVTFRLDEVLDRPLRGVEGAQSVDLELMRFDGTDAFPALLHVRLLDRIPECPELADPGQGTLLLFPSGNRIFYRALLVPAGSDVPEGHVYLDVRIAVSSAKRHHFLLVSVPQHSARPEGFVPLFNDETFRARPPRGALEIHDHFGGALDGAGASNWTGVVAARFLGRELIFPHDPRTFAPYEGRKSAVGDSELAFALEVPVEFRPGQRFYAAVRSFSRNVEITLFYESDRPRSVAVVLAVGDTCDETSFRIAAPVWSRIAVPFADFYAVDGSIVPVARVTGFRFRNVRLLPEKGSLAVDDVYLA